MLINDEYQPINCDDYDNLELACQHKLVLQLVLRDGNKIEAQAVDLSLSKKVEYLHIKQGGEETKVRLDNIDSFTHPEIGTVVVSLSD